MVLVLGCPHWQARSWTFKRQSALEHGPSAQLGRSRTLVFFHSTDALDGSALDQAPFPAAEDELCWRSLTPSPVEETDATQEPWGRAGQRGL